MINLPKVDYGLFRATRSHNPPSIRALVVLRTTTHSCRGAPTPYPSTASKLAWRSGFWRCNQDIIRKDANICIKAYRYKYRHMRECVKPF